ncbi:MAG: hypothetical protein ACRD9S_09205 [Pyrinomonadaceae bacterium]
MTPISIRQRLQDYEFTDEQELTLTLELLNRIEQDIHDLKSTNPRHGFNLYVAIAGIATTVFLILGELNKVTAISFSSIGTVFFASILLLKIPWAFNQILMFDQASRRNQEPGRFFWSNDFFFENRPGGTFQVIVFLICLLAVFFLRVPFWIKFSTALSFLLYIFIIVLIIVFSFRKKAYKPQATKTKLIVGFPIPFLVTTTFSIVGLISHMMVPIGSESQPYVIGGLLVAIVFFLDMLIRLWTPSVLLNKLQTLRYDIIFLKADLRDAWIRYDIHINGSDISEELRTDMEDVIRSFSSLDFHQSRKLKTLSVIHQELQRLRTREKLAGNDFDTIDREKRSFFAHDEETNRLDAYLTPRLKTLADQIHEISRATQEWERADGYHQTILARIQDVSEKEAQIAKNAKDADEQLKSLRGAEPMSSAPPGENKEH